MKKIILSALVFTACSQAPKQGMSLQLKEDTLCMHIPSDMIYSIDSPLNKQYFKVELDSASGMRTIYMQLNPYKMLYIDTGLGILYFMPLDKSLPANHPIENGCHLDSISHYDSIIKISLDGRIM